MHLPGHFSSFPLYIELRSEIEKLRGQLTGEAAQASAAEEVAMLKEQLLQSEKLISELRMTASEKKAVTDAITRERAEILRVFFNVE